MKERIIGLDIGTTGARAVVFDREGNVHASATGEYPLLVPRPGLGEQEPEVIFQTVLSALRDVVAAAKLGRDEVSAIGVSSVMHSMIAVDRHDRPLTNAWTWVDTRAARQAARLKKDLDAGAVYARTGCPMHPMYLPAKMVHLRETQPDLFEKTARFVSTKEYILSRLYGCRVVDYSIASGSGLLNMHRKEIDDELLAATGVRRDQVSDLVEPTSLLRGMRSEFADFIGLSPDTPLAVGASDGTLSTLGVGAVSPGQMTAMIGTSGAVRAIADRPTVDGQSRTWCYYLAEGKWVAGAAINNGGIVYRWVRDDVLRVPADQREEAYTAMDEEAAAIEPGSSGLIFLPFLTGERAPYWNADARGVMFGLSLGHTQAHILRASLEGVAYRMYSIYLALRDVAGHPNEIRATGGFTKSPLWVQILSDVFGHTMRVPLVHEASAFGAAVLAMKGTGLVDDLADVQRLIRIQKEYPPNVEKHARYEPLFDFYLRLYWHLQDQFAEIAAIQRGEGRSAR